MIFVVGTVFAAASAPLPMGNGSTGQMHGQMTTSITGTGVNQSMDKMHEQMAKSVTDPELRASLDKMHKGCIQGNGEGNEGHNMNHAQAPGTGHMMMH